MSIEILGVGAGRDGTLSLNHILSDILRHLGLGESVHEYESVGFHNRFCRYSSTHDPIHLEQIAELIRRCPHHAIVGNGYASILDQFRAANPGMKLIHLKRRDKDAFLRSILRNQELFPETYLHYGSERGSMERVAAFHVGEMAADEWYALPLRERFAWYYDYTHRTIQANQGRFRDVLLVETETLSETETMRRLAEFVAADAKYAPAPVRLNSHTYLDVDDFAPDLRYFAQWLFGQFDVQSLERDPFYMVKYFSDAFLTWMRYLRTGAAAGIHPTYREDDAWIRDSLERFIRSQEVAIERAKLEISAL